MSINLDNLDIIYEKEEYIAFKGGNNDIVVYNTAKPFKEGHTHLQSKKRVEEIIDNSIKNNFPLHWSNYFINSMIRITDDDLFREELIHLRETRKSKDRKYFNIPGYLR